MSYKIMIEKIVATQNPTVVGLDVKLDYIPNFIKQAAFEKHGKSLTAAGEAIFEYNKIMLDELCDIIPAVKLQLAYYEMYGYAGVKAYYDTIEYAHKKGVYVIADGKRNDIGPTMEAYITAHLGETDVEGELCTAFGADSLTVNGYLGTDGVAPAIDTCNKLDKGIFVLVKTSNPSSGELQDKLIGEKSVYENMAELVCSWGAQTEKAYGYNAIGAVVGATYPAQLKEMRAKMPETFLLIPGFGVQGGKACDVALGFDKNGLGAIVNNSRGILTAWQKDENEQNFQKSARNAVLKMKSDLLEALSQVYGIDKITL